MYNSNLERESEIFLHGGIYMDRKHLPGMMDMRSKTSEFEDLNFSHPPSLIFKSFSFILQTSPFTPLWPLVDIK